MSIKRTQSRSTRQSSHAGSGSSIFGAGKPKEKEPVWQEDVADRPDDAFTAYSRAGRFASGELVSHPTFGKGLVVRIDGKKMEVLFSDSRRTLAIGG